MSKTRVLLAEDEIALAHIVRESLEDALLSEMSVRMAVKQRIDAQQQTAKSDKKDNPYLFLLVRPEGLAGATLQRRV